MTNPNPTSQPDAIRALIGLDPVRIRCTDNMRLEVVELTIANGREPITVVLIVTNALDLALRLIGASGRITKMRLAGEGEG